MGEDVTDCNNGELGGTKDNRIGAGDRVRELVGSYFYQPGINLNPNQLKRNIYHGTRNQGDQSAGCQRVGHQH
jgi:hypothetical protein